MCRSARLDLNLPIVSHDVPRGHHDRADGALELKALRPRTSNHPAHLAVGGEFGGGYLERRRNRHSTRRGRLTSILRPAAAAPRFFAPEDVNRIRRRRLSRTTKKLTAFRPVVYRVEGAFTGERMADTHSSGGCSSPPDYVDELRQDLDSRVAEEITHPRDPPSSARSCLLVPGWSENSASQTGVRRVRCKSASPKPDQGFPI